MFPREIPQYWGKCALPKIQKISQNSTKKRIYFTILRFFCLINVYREAAYIFIFYLRFSWILEQNGGNFYSQILDPQKNCLEIFLYKNCSVLRNKNHEHILKEIILHGFSVVLLIFLCLLKHKFYLNERINMYVNVFAHTREAKLLIKVLTYNDVRMFCIP